MFESNFSHLDFKHSSFPTHITSSFRRTYNNDNAIKIKIHAYIPPTRTRRGD